VILVDTSVWIDHFHRTEPALVNELAGGRVLCHPRVVEELAAGTLPDRETTLELLGDLGHVPVLSHDEYLSFVAARRLWGKGIGPTDIHLLGSTLLADGTELWTRDKRLRTAAANAGAKLFAE
jgi:predicted nucleic acid-binding protein